MSRNHIMKVVYELGVGGYIETARGKHGGMRLAKRPQDIGLGEIVRRGEPDTALAPCFEPIQAACVITPACMPRRALQRARDSFMAVLDGYALADLTENRAALSLLLDVGAGTAGALAGQHPALDHAWRPGVHGRLGGERRLRRPSQLPVRRLSLVPPCR
jgi:Rrf2 family nitric oxide-sensitive transcriptional repressor